MKVSHSRPVLGGARMPQKVRGLGDLEEEAAVEEHVFVLIGQGAEIVELSGQLTLELLEGPAQDFSDLLPVLFSVVVVVEYTRPSCIRASTWENAT